MLQKCKEVGTQLIVIVRCFPFGWEVWPAVCGVRKTCPNSLSLGHFLFQVEVLFRALEPVECGAFWECGLLTRDVLAVTIPSSVTAIVVGAFAGCMALVKVDIPNTVVQFPGIVD